MKIMTFLKGAAIGAGAMYLFDPTRGRSRRARIRDKAVHTWNETGDAVESKARDLANRTQGLLHDAAALVTPRGAGYSAAGSGSSKSWMPSNWSPTTRLLVTAGAGLLAFYGKRRGDMLGTALGALSVGLITNTVSTRELRNGLVSAPSLPTDYPEPEDHQTSMSGVTGAEHRPRASRGY